MSVTLTINGTVYSKWTSVTVTRSLKRACSAFQVETPAELDPPILPFASVVVASDGETVLTGYVDLIAPWVSARSSKSRVEGRSKTEDLVDCIPELVTNQFESQTLDALARGMAAPFGINVVVNADTGGPFKSETFERSETAFRFLDRIARMRGVLLTDDAAGDLVITTLGTAPAAAPLIMGPGGNVFRADGRLDGKQRFSKYTIRAQAGMDLGNGTVYPGIAGNALDSSVPRYRPWSSIAESAAMTGDATLRAQWEAAHRRGQGITATLSVPEWRAGGQLWQTNTLAFCNVPRLGLLGTMLISTVTYREDAHEGRFTELSVAPPSAFSPQPALASDATHNWSAAGVVPVPLGGFGGKTPPV